ncbi:MAG: hypothetical protein ACOCRX_06480 [Candidatus Woesearchaeota archaeon]
MRTKKYEILKAEEVKSQTEKGIWYKLKNLKMKELKAKKQIHFISDTKIIDLYQE